MVCVIRHCCWVWFLASPFIRGLCAKQSCCSPIAPSALPFPICKWSGGEQRGAAVTQHSSFCQGSSSHHPKNLNKTGILFLFIPFRWSFQGHLHKTSKILDGRAGEKDCFVDMDINTVCMWKNSSGEKCIKRYQGTIDAFLSSLWSVLKTLPFL